MICLAIAVSAIWLAAEVCLSWAFNETPED